MSALYSVPRPTLIIGALTGEDRKWRRGQGRNPRRLAGLEGQQQRAGGEPTQGARVSTQESHFSLLAARVDVVVEREPTGQIELREATRGMRQRVGGRIAFSAAESRLTIEALDATSAS